MKNLNVKSTLLGFGFGLIVASLMYSIYVYNIGALGLMDEKEILKAADKITERNEKNTKNTIFQLDDDLYGSEIKNMREISLNGNMRALSDSKDATMTSETMTVVTEAAVTEKVSNEQAIGKMSDEQVKAEADATTTAIEMIMTDAATENKTTIAAEKTTPTTKTKLTAEPTTGITTTVTTTKPMNAFSIENTTTKEAASMANTTTTAAAAKLTTIGASTEVTTGVPVSDSETYQFTIRRGDTATIVAQGLYDAQLIDSKEAFLKKLYANKLTGKLLDDIYELPSGMDLDTLIRKITVHS